MPRTATAAPTDVRLWRLLLARTHPDAGGRSAEESERIPFEGCPDPIALTRRALSLADELEHPYKASLRLLSNYKPAGDGRPQPQDRRGATHRQLAAIAHAAGMSYPERLDWYRVAESVPLSQGHAGHMLSRLKGRP